MSNTQTQPWHERANWFELFSPHLVEDQERYEDLFNRANTALRELADKVWQAVKDGGQVEVRNLAKKFALDMHKEFFNTGIGDTEPRANMAEVVRVAAIGEGYDDDRVEEMASLFRWGALHFYKEQS